MRHIVVAIVSLFSLFPLLMFITEVCGLSDDVGAIVSVILSWIVLPSIMLGFWKGQPDPSIIPLNVNDPIMQDQIIKAKSELARFIDGLNSGELEAYIKFPYEFGGEIEHVWGVAHSYQEGVFVVSLASEPVGEPEQDMPSRIKIKETDLEDWTLTDSKGSTKGGYTMLAMARIYEANYGQLPKAYAQDLRRFVDFNWPENA